MKDLAAKSAYGKLPLRGRIVERAEGWLLYEHMGPAPVIVMKEAPHRR